MQLSNEEIELVKRYRRDKDKFKPKAYTPEEKIAAFDQIYDGAIKHYEQVKETGFTRQDYKQWFFEACMNLLGKNVWDSYNEFLR